MRILQHFGLVALLSVVGSSFCVAATLPSAQKAPTASTSQPFVLSVTHAETKTVSTLDQLIQESKTNPTTENKNTNTNNDFKVKLLSRNAKNPISSPNKTIISLLQRLFGG